MTYDKGLHIDWWQKMEVNKRFELMKKHSIKQVNNKLIYRMWKAENN